MRSMRVSEQKLLIVLLASVQSSGVIEDFNLECTIANNLNRIVQRLRMSKYEDFADVDENNNSISFYEPSVKKSEQINENEPSGAFRRSNLHSEEQKVGKGKLQRQKNNTVDRIHTWTITSVLHDQKFGKTMDQTSTKGKEVKYLHEKCLPDYKKVKRQSKKSAKSK